MLEYNPLFPALNIAVNITAFITLAAKATPVLSNKIVKGSELYLVLLFLSKFGSVKGKSVPMIKITIYKIAKFSKILHL